MMAAEAAAFDFLSATLRYSPVWDWLRFIAAVATALLALLMLRVAFGVERPGPRSEADTVRWGVLCTILFAVPAMLTELQLIGQPFVPWRLPLVVAADIAGFVWLSRRL